MIQHKVKGILRKQIAEKSWKILTSQTRKIGRSKMANTNSQVGQEKLETKFQINKETDRLPSISGGKWRKTQTIN